MAVTLATAGPTAARHASITFSGVIGAFFSTAASASGMNDWIGITRRL
jgi:hypothetical protein